MVVIYAKIKTKLTMDTHYYSYTSICIINHYWCVIRSNTLTGLACVIQCLSSVWVHDYISYNCVYMNTPIIPGTCISLLDVYQCVEIDC